MWRRPTESGISFICILAPTRFFVKSIKINIYKNQYSTPRAENLFARKLLQPAFEFLAGQKLAPISLPQAQANQVARKKMHPAGRIFSSSHETLFLAQERKNILRTLVCRGLKISSPASSSSPLSSFCQAKTRFYLFLTGSGKSGSSRHKKKAPRRALFISLQN